MKKTIEQIIREEILSRPKPHDKHVWAWSWANSEQGKWEATLPEFSVLLCNGNQTADCPMIRVLEPFGYQAVFDVGAFQPIEEVLPFLRDSGLDVSKRRLFYPPSMYFADDGYPIMAVCNMPNTISMLLKLRFG